MDTKTKHKRFANKMIEALRREGETRPIRYDAQEFKLVIGGESSHKVELFLGNAFEKYHAAPLQDREAVLQHFAQGIRETEREHDLPRDFNQARPHLLPCIHPRAYYTYQLPAQTKDQFWHRPLGLHLALGLAYDLPHAHGDVDQGRLEDWGVTGEEAFALACDNLRSRSTPPFDSPVPGVFMSRSPDKYGASQLALTDIIQGLKVKGDHVAMAPNRDFLIVTGSEDEAGLRAMLDGASHAYQGPYRVSGVAVRLRQGGWEPFAPDEHFPALVGFRSLRHDSLGSAYEDQARASVRATEGADKPKFAAFLNVLPPAGGPGFSCCTWGEGIQALLPCTDKVALIKGDRKENFRLAAFAAWDRVQEVVGDLMTPVGLYPERFRVDQFPTDKQLEAIGFDPDVAEFRP
jgi:uncharacterized protein YtpQ (UPF0354 family)